MDLESLVFLEQSFYDAGFSDGVAHGRIHGLIEGRALGREKGFEMWEELGFYEGFAKGWKGVLETSGNDRAIQHISQLLDSISQFPRASSPSTADLDIHRLQRQIRSRYRALCSSLGIRPRLQTASSQTSASLPESEMSEVRVALGSSIPVWKIDKKTGSKSAVTNMDLDF